MIIIGSLVMDFLNGELSPRAYLEEIAKIGHKFNGFFLATIAFRYMLFIQMLHNDDNNVSE